MTRNRIASLAVCLGVAFLLLTGSALAGITSVSPVVTYAREVGAPNAVFTVPTGAVTRALAVIRNTAQDFFVDVTLGNGATFTGSGATLPADGDLTITGGAGASTPVIISGGTANATTVRYFIDVTQSYTGLATLNLDVSGWQIRDVNNVIGNTGIIQITMVTTDAATNIVFDSGTDTVTWLIGKDAVTAGELVSTSATVDVAINRLGFITGLNGNDTTNQDNGASITFVNPINANVFGLTGVTYVASATDTIQVVISGNLSGITSVTVGGVTQGVSAANLAANSVAVTLPGATTGTQNISIRVDGTTQLTARTLTIASTFVSGSAATFPLQNHSLHGSATLTVWTLNGTILVAEWINGNNANLNGRIYLWNPGTNGGNITVRVFKLGIAPTTGTGTPLATVAVGSIGGLSGRNLRLAEDILLPGGIALPYQTDGGNLVVEATIEASGVSGISQTFGSAFAFGTYRMTNVGQNPGPPVSE